MISRTPPQIDLLFVIAPHSLLLDIAGPAEAFRLANLHRAARREPPRFNLRFTGPAPEAITSVGLALAELEPLPAHLTAPTWVVPIAFGVVMVAGVLWALALRAGRPRVIPEWRYRRVGRVNHSTTRPVMSSMTR